MTMRSSYKQSRKKNDNFKRAGMESKVTLSKKVETYLRNKILNGELQPKTRSRNWTWPGKWA